MACYSRKLSKGIRWFYRFYFDSIPYTSTCKYYTKAEAKKAERAHIKEVEDAKSTTAKNCLELKLTTLIDERLAYVKSRKSIKYHIDTKYYIDIFKNFIGDKLVKEISKRDINRLLQYFSDKQKGRGKTNHSVNSLLRAIKALFNYGIDYFELEIINPCKGIKMYPIDKKIKYIPSDDEIATLLDSCDEMQRLLINFVMQTGARIGEALRFKTTDIYDAYVVLYTRKSENSNLTLRKIPRPDCLKNFTSKEERIFNRWSDAPDFLEDKLKDLNLTKWGWHNLRHRYASKLSKENKPIFEIMMLLGHSNLETTQNYLQLLP
jgi:integrase